MRRDLVRDSACLPRLCRELQPHLRGQLQCEGGAGKARNHGLEVWGRHDLGRRQTFIDPLDEMFNLVHDIVGMRVRRTR